MSRGSKWADRINAIHFRLQDTTPGKWRAYNAAGTAGRAWGVVAKVPDQLQERIVVEHDFISKGDARFCADAKADVQWLIETVIEQAFTIISMADAPAIERAAKKKEAAEVTNYQQRRGLMQRAEAAAKRRAVTRVTKQD